MTFGFSTTFRHAIIAFLFCLSPKALATPEGVLCNRNDECHAKGIYTKHSPGPTKSDAVRLNPAEVPFETITGIETIYYKNSFDFALVRGLGRVGAALTPSNNQETFFGAPAAEDPNLYQNRMIRLDKYDAPKYVLAAGFDLYSKEGSGFDHVELSIGAMGRYNKVLGKVSPGGGLVAIAGPLSLGGSIYQDQDVVDSSIPGQAPLLLMSQVTIFTAGLTLQSVSIDYSIMRVASNIPSTASVVTLTGYLGRAILTAARRQVDSLKPGYDFSSQMLIAEDTKVDLFLGAQYRIAPFLVLGVFYNYYLLHEGSVGATVFF